MDVKSNPIYIREKAFHKIHCDMGYYYSINKYSGEMTEERCPYCKRIDDYKQMKKLKAMGVAHAN